MSDSVICCENVSKKFCRDLKKSLWYGITDSVSDLVGRSSETDVLRDGEFWANKGISFELKRGECLGLIGHNGAGKTTLLKMLNGLIKPDTGRITIKGRVGALIALGAGFNPVLSGRENIFVNSSVLGRTRRETQDNLDEIVAFADLEDAIDAPVRTYSSGMQVRLGFAIAAQLEPEIMLVDEVLAVGDNAFQKKCFDRIYELRRSGTSFIVVSHNPYQLERLCDYVAAMADGRIIKLADPKEAIYLYHTELKKRHVKPSDKGSSGSAIESVGLREGTGEARFASVFIADNNGIATEEIETGDGFTISADCDFKTTMNDIRFRFTLYSDSNIVIANIGSNSKTEFYTFPEGLNHVECHVPRCDLMTGVYSIEAVIVSSRGDRIDRIGEAVKFSIVTRDIEIVERTAGQGLVHLNGDWSVVNVGKKPNSITVS